MKYISKSRFKLALECITKLYYTQKKSEYADESLDDPFMEALAEGGFQVGELAKFIFSDDPVKERLTIESLGYDESLRETRERLSKPGRVVIAEAAFLHESLFVRVDLTVKDGSIVNIYEVKSKSIDDEPIDFISTKKEPKIASGWVQYLYDIAFQKHVVTEAFKGQGLSVRAHLVLVDKSKVATVDGLNQKFKIARRDDRRVKVEMAKGIDRTQLGDSILRIENVDEVIQRIWDEFPVPTDYSDSMGFREFIGLCTKVYNEDQRTFAPLGTKCRGCQFVTSDTGGGALKSGFHECWKKQTGYSDELLNKDLVLSLWAGKSGGTSLVGSLIRSGKYLIENVDESDIASGGKDKDHYGLSPHGRRMEQITRVKKGTTQSYFDRKGFEEEMHSWVYPLHMIDFETTTTALPFHKGRHPYEGIAFQFSHHTIQMDGSIRHAGQYLSFEPGVFPNYDFVRALKAQLEHDAGSVFRYHNHENTYLKKIHDQLFSDPTPQADRDELMSFIRTLTILPAEGGGKKDKIVGRRCMIDLWDLVLRYYYSPYAKGSNSIKRILPAIIHDSEYLRTKYSRPIYGKTKEVTSLNIDSHVWIRPEYNNDPYKTLAPLFTDYDTDVLDKMIVGLDEIADGGAAMTAYNYLQFSEIPDEQRRILRDGLLRYCELDTMAMVMIVEGWMNMT